MKTIMLYWTSNPRAITRYLFNFKNFSSFASGRLIKLSLNKPIKTIVKCLP